MGRRGLGPLLKSYEKKTRYQKSVDSKGTFDGVSRLFSSRLNLLDSERVRREVDFPETGTQDRGIPGFANSTRNDGFCVGRVDQACAGILGPRREEKAGPSLRRLRSGWQVLVVMGIVVVMVEVFVVMMRVSERPLARDSPAGRNRSKDRPLRRRLSAHGNTCGDL